MVGKQVRIVTPIKMPNHLQSNDDFRQWMEQVVSSIGIDLKVFQAFSYGNVGDANVEIHTAGLIVPIDTREWLKVHGRI